MEDKLKLEKELIEEHAGKKCVYVGQICVSFNTILSPVWRVLAPCGKNPGR